MHSLHNISYVLFMLFLTTITSNAAEIGDLFLVHLESDSNEYVIIEQASNIEDVEFCKLKYQKRYYDGSERINPRTVKATTYNEYGRVVTRIDIESKYKLESWFIAANQGNSQSVWHSASSRGASYSVVCAVDDLKDSLKDVVSQLDQNLPQSIVAKTAYGEKLYKVKQHKRWIEPAFKFKTIHAFPSDIKQSKCEYMPLSPDDNFIFFHLDRHHALLNNEVMIGNQEFIIKYIANTQESHDSETPVVLEDINNGEMHVRMLSEILKV